MLFSKEVIELVASLIESAPINHLVVDPVMIGKMNSKLLKDDAIEALKKYLIPLATIITPNIPEASVLLDHRSISTVDEMKKQPSTCNNSVLKTFSSKVDDWKGRLSMFYLMEHI